MAVNHPAAMLVLGGPERSASTLGQGAAPAWFDSNEHDILVTNTSVVGLGIQCPHFLRPGTMVVVRFAGQRIRAVVRNCRPAAGEFCAGLEIQEASDARD
jgi:hypothetical protein